MVDTLQEQKPNSTHLLDWWGQKQIFVLGLLIFSSSRRPADDIPHEAENEHYSDLYMSTAALCDK